MKNNTQEFDFKGTPVRVRVDDETGEPWFCLADVCGVLDIANPRNVVSRLNEDGVRAMDIIDSMGRTQQATFINEQNLYKVIFQSRKPEAEAFVDWVTGEVLPAIRKTGFYAAPEAACPDPADCRVMGGPGDLLQSTVSMLDALNRRIEAGENVPPHILKYAWNMANCTRTRTLQGMTAAELLSPEYAAIRPVFDLFAPGQVIPRRDVYKAYCERTECPMSARRFWPFAKKVVKFRNLMRSTGRCIIIEL